jgi:hypothetical protein
MAPELIHARLRGSQILRFQQTGQGCTQAETGHWQHEDEAFMDALELIDRRKSYFTSHRQILSLPHTRASHFRNEKTSITSRSRETVSISIAEFTECYELGDAANVPVSSPLVPMWRDPFLRFRHHHQPPPTKRGAEKEDHEKMFPLDIRILHF